MEICACVKHNTQPEQIILLFDNLYLALNKKENFD